ncbi:hypothetical protein Tco_0351654 [Tanacetum coccineum]
MNMTALAVGGLDHLPRLSELEDPDFVCIGVDMSRETVIVVGKIPIRGPCKVVHTTFLMSVALTEYSNRRQIAIKPSQPIPLENDNNPQVLPILLLQRLDMAPLPPRGERYLWLRFDGQDYLDGDIQDFEDRLGRIYNRKDEHTGVDGRWWLIAMLEGSVWDSMPGDHLDGFRQVTVKVCGLTTIDSEELIRASHINPEGPEVAVVHQEDATPQMPSLGALYPYRAKEWKVNRKARIWELKRRNHKDYCSENPYVISIKEDTAYLCPKLHTASTKKVLCVLQWLLDNTFRSPGEILRKVEAFCDSINCLWRSDVRMLEVKAASYDIRTVTA